MTLADKLEQLKNASMEEARAEGNKIIADYQSALKKLLEAHKEDAKKQAALRLKTESMNSKQRTNQTLIKAQLELKRKNSGLQQELKEKIFSETKALLKDFINSEAYFHFLEQKILQTQEFAKKEKVVFYLDPMDEAKLLPLIAATKADISISNRAFGGGIRGLIEEKQILIDNSFDTLMGNEFDHFMFGGGGVGSP